MNLYSRIALGALLLNVSQLSFAILAGPPVASVPTGSNPTATVERGGTINLVDRNKKIVVIDGISYPYSTAIKTHALPSKTQGNPPEFKSGMQIRFNTSKERGSAPDRINEIWVTSLDGKPARAR